EYINSYVYSTRYTGKIGYNWSMVALSGFVHSERIVNNEESMFTYSEGGEFEGETGGALPISSNRTFSLIGDKCAMNRKQY
ncbi:hypothetical protein PENTCL1PPCAC_18134, partial [Pristionchus entomophagus]